MEITICDFQFYQNGPTQATLCLHCLGSCNVKQCFGAADHRKQPKRKPIGFIRPNEDEEEKK